MDAHDELYVLLGDFLRRLFSQMDVTAMDRLVEADLSLSQARLLLTLSYSDAAMPIGELAEILRLSVTTASRNVDQLVRLGLLERAENPADRRVKLISLSPAGADITGERVESEREALQAFVDSVPVENCESLIDALQPLLDGRYLKPTANPAA